MKLNEKALANGMGTFGGVYYLGCYLAASLFPGLYKTVAASWLHMLDLSTSWKSAPSGLVMGLVSFTLVSWLSGLAIAKFYKYFVRSK